MKAIMLLDRICRELIHGNERSYLKNTFPNIRSGKVSVFFIICILSCCKKTFYESTGRQSLKQTLLSAYSGK